MRMFVSYSRADNSLERLVALRARLAGSADVYVDDLDWAASGFDREDAVHRELVRASIFVAVVSVTYRKTPWTAWEFDVALKRGIPKLAYLPDGRLVDERSDEWPFASADLTGSVPSVPPRVLRGSTRGRHRISGSS